MNKTLTTLQTLLLLLAGSLLVLIAMFILASPAGFYAANQIDIGASISLLNELKAPAGFLLASGTIMLIAVFRRQWAANALALGALIYLSYALSRIASMATDGLPAPGLVQAAGLEGVAGLACLGLLLINRASATGAAS